MVVKEKFLDRAARHAKLSNCQRRKYGAVLVYKNRKIIGEGYTFISDNAECLKECPREKNNVEHNNGNYCDCQSKHAEITALINSKPKDLLKNNIVLYLYGYDKNGNTIIDAEPCLACKKYLKFAGINTYINLTGEHELN